MELNEAIAGRRATRQYTRKSVDAASLQGLIVAATHAPSAVDQQPWAFTVVRNQEKLGVISQNARLVANEPTCDGGPWPSFI
jgi:nitroreductase